MCIVWEHQGRHYAITLEWEIMGTGQRIVKDSRSTVQWIRWDRDIAKNPKKWESIGDY